MKKIRVSLVVFNYNGKIHLREYFTSVFKQTKVPDEIILFDNGSSDESVAYVAKRFPKVKIFQNSFNAGTALGSNIAFSHTSGDYVIFQSNDIVLDSHCIKSLINTINDDPTIGICTSVALYIDRDTKKKTHKIENAGGYQDIFGFSWPAQNGKKLKSIPSVKEVFLSYGSSFIIRRHLFETVGGFDDAFFTLNDDVDLSWRVRLQKYRIVYTKRSFLYHKGHATLGPLFPRWVKRYWSERNCMRTLLKNYGLSSLIFILPGYFSLLTAEMAYYCLRGRFDLFWAVLKAVAWNMRYFPDTMSKRAIVQKKRKVNDVYISQLLSKTSFKLLYFNNFKQSI